MQAIFFCTDALKCSIEWFILVLRIVCFVFCFKCSFWGLVLISATGGSVLGSFRPFIRLCSSFNRAINNSFQEIVSRDDEKRENHAKCSWFIVASIDWWWGFQYEKRMFRWMCIEWRCCNANWLHLHRFKITLNRLIRSFLVVQLKEKTKLVQYVFHRISRKDEEAKKKTFTTSRLCIANVN